MAAIGIRLAVLDDTRTCPAAAVCKEAPNCLLGDGDRLPHVTLSHPDHPGATPEVVCTEFEPVLVEPESE